MAGIDTFAHDPQNMSVGTDDDEPVFFLENRSFDIGQEIAHELAAFHAVRHKAIGSAWGTHRQRKSNGIGIETCPKRLTADSKTIVNHFCRYRHRSAIGKTRETFGNHLDGFCRRGNGTNEQPSTIDSQFVGGRQEASAG